MKLFLALTTLFLAIFSTFSFAAALDTKSLISRDENTDMKFVTTELSDGKKTEVFSGETLEGTIVEHSDDTIKMFYGDGEELNLEELKHDSESNGIEKRGRWSIIVRLGKLIAKWGKKAWAYIWCVGAESMLRCDDE
ncbi:hypothetical protein PHISP_08002, partial [Aspergillus sp. HF37]